MAEKKTADAPKDEKSVPTAARNIFQRMQAVTAEMGVIDKDLSIEVSKSKSYKAVSERAVMDAVKPLEDKHGIYSYPVSTEIIDSGTMTQTFRDGGTKDNTYLRTHMRVRFVNVDDPGDYVEVDSFGDGIDPGDKAPGKAMTYSKKYAYLLAYKISTGEDLDVVGSPEEGYTRRGGGNSGGYGGGRAPIPQADLTPRWCAPAPGDAPVICTKCGRRINDWWDGTKTIKAANLAERSKHRAGKILCSECIQGAAAGP